MDRKQVLHLLAESKDLGFSNDAFWRLHHKRLNKKQERETISGMEEYCAKGSSFMVGGANERVYKRLAFVLGAYKMSELPAGQSPNELFNILAETAFVAIPPQEGDFGSL